MPKVREVHFALLPLRTRFPFKYGIASMTEVPHLFVRVTLEVDGKITTGLSADLLPPKWFTKNPATEFYSQDLPEIHRVIQHAADVSRQLETTGTFFQWWHSLYTAQMKWAKTENFAPLLANFGVSLIERATIDAFCRADKSTFHSLLRENIFGIEFGELRDSLSGLQPRDVIAPTPNSSLTVRHTIGMADPLSDAEITEEDRVEDGLPQSLEASIRAYGLHHFKIKISGKLEQDRERLCELSKVIKKYVPDRFRFTMDGNENYATIEHFRNDFEALKATPQLKQFFEQGLMCIEQPLHRDQALDESVRNEIAQWKTAPPLIIDESDADLESLPRALDLGYSGTSHKNCKGIIKGLTNAATIWKRKQSGQPAILSSEDLANLGPVALMQDLAVVASLGIQHTERNGHHYFAGLSQIPSSMREQVLEKHAGLYHQTESGFPSLQIENGSIKLESVLHAPFGTSLDVGTVEIEWVDDVTRTI